MSLNASIPKTNVALSAASEATSTKVGGNNASQMNANIKAHFVNASPKLNANAAPKLNANVKAAANVAKVNSVPQSAGSKKAAKSGKAATVKRGGANVTTPPLNSSAVVNATKAPLVANAAGNAAAAVPAAPAVGGRKSKSASSKRGGALVDDLKNLAVPFAILLAKQGVENMYAKKNAKSTKGSPKSAASPSSSRRRSTLSGGSACASGCGMTGGYANAANAAKVKQNFSKIAADIDAFLKKY